MAGEHVYKLCRFLGGEIDSKTHTYLLHYINNGLTYVPIYYLKNGVLNLFTV